METVSHEEYVLLNNIHRDGSKEQKEIVRLDYLRKRGWVKRCHPDFREMSEDSWELSSTGRLEHNLYEKVLSYSDGCSVRRKGCPRCGDSDPECPICLGYKS